MAFKVELTIDEQVFSVRDFYLSVLRETDPRGQPSSNPNWILDVTIDAVNDTTITQWMIDPTKQVDGSLSIFKLDGEATLKSIEFKKSSCSTMVDCFIPELSEASCYIRIVGEEISIGPATLALER